MKSAVVAIVTLCLLGLALGSGQTAFQFAARGVAVAAR